VADDNAVSEIMIRVNYSETDRMGVAYHGRYPVWFDMARTEHLRRTGVSYRELEDSGLLLTVSELQVRYRRGAEYDDLIRIRCWVREVATRRVTFGYVVEHAGRGDILATGMTSLIAVNRDFGVVHLPTDLKDALCAIPDPVRI
jgi:acyl-CoA thioester hydrolase